MNDKRMTFGVDKINKRYSLNILQRPTFGAFYSQMKNIKILSLEDLLKSENKNDKKLHKFHLKKETVKLKSLNSVKKALTFFPKIESNFKKDEIEFLIPFEKIANQKLKDQYNYKYKERFYFMKKEEIPTQYDYNQLTFLIEKRRCRIFSQLNELFFLNNIQEFLRDIYNYKQSKIILKYLLYFIYDKDLITYIEKPDNEKHKKYIKSNFDKLSFTLKEKKEVKTIFGDNREIINKYIKNDESILYELEKINNNIFISYDFSKVKYLYIYNIPASKIYNCIPNIFPNGFKILNILKDFLNIKKSQKLFNNKIYSFKNCQNNDSNMSNENNCLDPSNKKKKFKNYGKYLFDNSSLLSSREINNNLYENDYSIHYHSNNNTRREKNDMEINDVEKIIKNISGEKHKKLLEFSEKYNKPNLKLFKKSLYIKKYMPFSQSNNNNVNNFSQTNEKLQISENSTTLSNRNKITTKNGKTKIQNEKINDSQNSFSKKIFLGKEKNLNDSFKSEKKINIKKALLNFSSSKNEEKRYSIKNIKLNKNILIPNENKKSIYYKKIDIKKNDILKIRKNIEKNNKKSISSYKIKQEKKDLFKETNKFSPVKNHHKIIKHKLTKLKELLKIKINLNDSKANNKEEIKYYNSYYKGFEYLPEIFFLKNKNQNIWESGEDISEQKKCDNYTKHIMNNLQKSILKNKKSLNNSSTFRQIIKCGNIYENNYSII